MEGIIEKHELEEILRRHKEYFSSAHRKGSRANLSGKNLTGHDLSNAFLPTADFICSTLINANLTSAYLGGADLTEANLSGADLSEAFLESATLRRTNLSGAKGLTSPIDFIESHYEKTPEGYIAYKEFNYSFDVPAYWKIEKGAVIEENVNFNRCDNSGCGISVSPLNHFLPLTISDVLWKVLIRWEWLAGVCVPYHSDGEIRCERVELLEIVPHDKENSITTYVKGKSCFRTE